MNSENNIRIYQQASVWAERLKTDPSFTDSDTEELKGHLIDLAEELKEKGLDEDEAFNIASLRLGDSSLLKNEFEKVNTPIIQMRKIILVLSGILAYFLLYFLMLSSTRLLVILLFQINGDPEQNVWYIFYQVAAFHLFLIIFTLHLTFRGKRIVVKIARLKIKPKHAFILFAGILCLAIADQWLRMIIRSLFEVGNYTNTHLHAIFDYSAYSFPLILILCFFLLYKKYYPLFNQGSTDSGLNNELLTISQITNTELDAGFDSNEQIKSKSDEQMKELIQMGLEEDEALWVVQRRKAPISLEINDYGRVANSSGNEMRVFLIVFSGVLVYFFFYFLLYSSAHIFFTVLQQIENAPLLNISRTWSYVLIYQFFFIFFTVSLYILDENLIKGIKQIHIKPRHTLWIFIATVVLSIIDRCFYPITQNSIGQDMALKYKFGYIFYISNYSFPLILSVCFLLLFNKYYRNNIKIS